MALRRRRQAASGPYRGTPVQATGSGSGQVLVVEGAKELNRQLDSIPAAIRRKALRNSLTYGARVVRTEVRKRTPQRTRTLHWAVQSRVSLHKGTALVEITHGRGERRDAYFWHMQEYGMIRHAAQPFVRPGYDAWESRIIKEFERHLNRTLAQYAD